MNRLEAAGERLSALMRERGADHDNPDVHTAMLGALTEAYLYRFCDDPRYPTFVPCCTWFQHTGSPNPDTVYRRAPIDEAGVYRLTGEPGTARQVTIMPFEEPSMRSMPPLDLLTVATGSDGRIDLLISRERPPSYEGDWWAIPPGATSLWLRSVSDHWIRDADPRLAIVRLDAPRRPRPSGSDASGRLTALALTVERTIEYGIRHVDELVRDGYVNALKLVNYGTTGGMPLQWYHEGLFDLADDQALLVEAVLPDGCDYVSWSLTDRMLVTLDWTHAQTSLNLSQATLDDRVLRVVVSTADPGVRNWMDTTGYRTGVLQCREIGSVEPPLLSTRVVPLASVAEHLPASHRIDPPDRADALQQRRTGAQLRRLW
jgi:hypothetical protein